MDFKDYLKILVLKDGSDLYLTTGAPPSAKIDGRLMPIDKDSLPPGRVKEIAYSIMDKGQIADFEKTPEMNLALSEPGVGRFRVNIFQQRNQVGMVVRAIKMDIPDTEKLGLPPVLKKLIMEKRGLILFVGGTGSGKSTSLASLIDYRNTHSAGHIITIEDPIEFVHKHKKSIINQREVGIDTPSYEAALKNTLRQAPDVILIGEIRDQHTMEHALAFAETGHLAISTLHANNANQAFDRIINFFPEERRNQLLLDLSLNVRAFISQRLIPTMDGKRAAAIEVLINTPRLADLIHKGEIHAIKELMEKSENVGMQTFDSALHKLYREERISLEEALRNADSQNNLRLKITLEEADGESAPGDNPLKLVDDNEEPEAKAELKLENENNDNLSYQDRLKKTVK
ncbi:MAG: twitching motility protein PilU [Gammaproteobacteria bacterium]|nr:MAG: twitching motility protein PilU [Gammaproteobacteria bacterium]TND05834.1 MAG: twitching motility protein PilU [Gammaproteobacteria bacterium]